MRVHKSALSTSRYISVDAFRSSNRIEHYVHVPGSEEVAELEKRQKSVFGTRSISVDDISSALTAWCQALGSAEVLQPAIWQPCPGGLSVPIPVVAGDSSTGYRLLEGQRSAAALLQLNITSLRIGVLVRVDRL